MGAKELQQWLRYCPTCQEETLQVRCFAGDFRFSASGQELYREDQPIYTCKACGNTNIDVAEEDE